MLLVGQRLLLLLLFTGLAWLNAAEKKSLSEQLAVKITSWKVLIAPTKILSLDSEGFTRAGSFPHLLQKGMSDFRYHLLSPHEREILRQNSKNTVVNALHKKIVAKIDARDDKLFKETGTEKRRLEQEKLDKDIVSLRKELAKIEEFQLKDITVTDKLRLEVATIDRDSYKGALDSIAQNKADLVLWAEMNGQQGVYFVRLLALQRGHNDVDELWSGSISKASEKYLDSIRDFMATLLLGRSWSNLTITLQPKEGRIYLDSQLVGVGQINKYGLESNRPYEIEIYPQGYKSFRHVLTLEAYETRKIEWPLEKQQEKYLVVDSGNISAEVYLGSRFVGMTPLKMRSPDYSQTITLLASGYQPITQTLEASASNTITFKLEPNPALTAEQELKTRRDQFYLSASFFTVSLLLPVISGGLSDNAKALAQKNQANGFTSAAAKYRQEATVGQVFFWSGLALSAGLLTWSVVNLIHYITAVERNAQPNMRSTYPEEKKQDDKSKATTKDEDTVGAKSKDIVGAKSKDTVGAKSKDIVGAKPKDIVGAKSKDPAKNTAKDKGEGATAN